MMRSRSIVLCLVTCLAVNVSISLASEECNTTVETLVKSAFLLNVGQQLRGADDKMLLPFFHDSVSALINDIEQKQTTINNGIGKVCVEDSEFEVLRLLNNNTGYNYTIPKGLEWSSSLNNAASISAFKLMGVSSAFHAIKSWENDPRFTNHVFYLPSSETADDQIPPISSEMGSTLYSMWNDMEKNLESNSISDLTEKIVQLPSTIDVFFDPHHDQVKESFTRQKQIGEEISADKLLYRVATMVLRLHKAGTPNDEALKLLRHAAAFIFNGMRSDRKEGNELTVSTLFLPFYERAFRNLSHNLELTSETEISEESVEIVYKDVLAPLLSFSSHGLLEHETWKNGLIEQVNFAELLFDDTRLNLIGANYTNETMAESISLRSWFNSEKGKFTLRTGENCDQASSFNYEYTIGDSTMCCAYYCSDVETLLILGDISAQQCCEACNSEACDSDSAGSVSEALRLVLEDYGFFNVTVISI